jgi:cell division transport system permease protein
MPKRVKQRVRRSSRRLRRRVADLPRIWAGRHLQDALASLGRLQRSPLPTVMTVAVIGIALALPGALYVLTRNLEQLSGGWQQTAGISLFLRVEVGLEQAEALAARLDEAADVAAVATIPPDRALEELSAEGGFAEAVAQLEENPLPTVLAVTPAPGVSTTAALEALGSRLRALPEADFARLDTQWIRRFQALVQLAERGVWLLAAALALGVLLVIGNTIRLEIQNRRSEIEIMEQVGATHGFIRRPFLYTGAWYGLLGGAAAWGLVALGVSLLQGPVSRLAGLYGGDFSLSGLGPGAALALLSGSTVLGLLGSWLSVGRHLAAAEPD